MAANPSESGPAGGDRSEAKVFSSGGGGGSAFADPKVGRFNNGVNCKVVLEFGSSTATSQTNVTVDMVYQALCRQQPLLSGTVDAAVNPTIPNWTNALKVMILHKIEVYGQESDYLTMVPALNVHGDKMEVGTPGGIQLYDYGVTGARLTHLTYTWPEAVARQNFIYSSSTPPSNTIAGIQSDNRMQMYVSLTVWSARPVLLRDISPFFAVACKKRKLQHIKDLKMPNLDE